MAVDAPDSEGGVSRRASVKFERFFSRNAELVLLQTGGDIGVGLRVDIRIYPDRNRCNSLVSSGDASNAVEL